VTDLPDPGAFGAAFEKFMQAMTSAAARPESGLSLRLREHLGGDPAALPTVAASFPTTEHPNLQLALDAVLPGAEPIGFTTQHIGFMAAGMAELISGHGMGGPVREGPVRYDDVEVGDGRVVRCVAGGLLLVRHGDAPVALAVSQGQRAFGGGMLRLEGVSPDRDAVSALLRELRAAMREHNVFRGRVISLHADPDEAVRVIYHAVPPVPREGLILPVGTLERLERQALGISAQASALRAAGRHLKRGVLLHGPPGTGKTLSVSYLIGAMPGRTTVLLTGRGLGLIEPAFAIARELAPATVVLEDIDLVAAERTFDMDDNGVLFELLNQIEGLQDDADLLFLLTTNRADLVEPALAARPGRIDLALEIPLPDADARARLVALYAGDAQLDAATQRDVVERTEGVSGAFIKELMRHAALRAALDGRRRPAGADVTATLDELLEERSALTRRLLGEGGGDAAAGPHPAMLRAMSAAGLPLPPDPLDEE
jgi:hypothetical protein